jgi:hypothetical protein
VWSTGHVLVTHVSARKARIDVSVDGVTFIRSKPEATRRGTAQRIHVGWDDVTGAEVETTSKGRTVIRVSVAGTAATAHHREDAHAVKVPRNQSDTAHQLVEQINDEVAARRRWREHSPT